MQASRSTLLPWTCRRCASLSSRPIALAATNRRWLTTETTEATTPASEEAAILKPVPRWKQTPERMMAIGPHPGSKKVVPYQVNEDPEVLDAFYERLLDGRKEVAAISEEIRWVAVTHKSFDHGRRGFNERLAFLGRQIVNIQATLGRLYSTTKSTAAADQPADRPPPFEHPDYQGLENLVPSSEDEQERRTNTRIIHNARQLGISQVIRWRPRDITNRRKSGEDAIILTSALGIIGAVSLSCGGGRAAALARKLLQKY